MYLSGGTLLVALIVYALVLQLGPRTLKVEIDDAQIAMAVEGEFLEYIDVNGEVCPATSMRVNAKVSCLVGNEPQTQAYVSKGVYCGCRASMQGALSAQGGITKRWGTE